MRGWSLSDHNGKVRLRLQFPKESDWPANAQANLPHAWEPSAETFTSVQGLVTRIHAPVMSCKVTLKAAIDDVLALSDNKADEVLMQWPAIVVAFKKYKLEQGNRIAETTFESSYGRYLSVTLVHLQGRKPAQTGKDLTQRVLAHQRVKQKSGIKQGEALKPWIEMLKSRLECCLALRKFLEYAVAEHRQPQTFLIADKDYLELRGADGKRRKKAVLTDEQVLELIKLLPESWANVVKISRVFGVRPWEIEFIARATNDDGKHQLHVTKGKTYTRRGGVKEETEPRWLEAVKVNDTMFDLVQKWDQLALPPTAAERPLEPS